MTSAAILVYTAQNAPTKGKSSQPKTNQHQLAAINQPQDLPVTGEVDYNEGHQGCGRGCHRSLQGCGEGGNSENRFDHQDQGAGHGQLQRDFQYNRGRGQDNSYRG